MSEKLYVRAKSSLTVNDEYLTPKRFNWREGEILSANHPYVLQYAQHFEAVPEYNGMSPQEAVDAGRRAQIGEAYRRAGATESAKSVSTRSTKSEPAASQTDKARRRIDELNRSGKLPDHASERTERLVSDGDSISRSLAARWVTEAGSDAYASAFWRKISDPEHGHTEFNDAERDAWRNVRDLQRSMAIGAGGTGGFMVPTHLDPAILLTNDGSNNALRQISRVEQILTTTWNGVSSAGATAEWKAESVEAADGSPTLTQPAVDTHLGDVHVPFSIEWQQDAAQAETELARIMRDEADVFQAAAFTTGDGSGKPFGVVESTTGATAVNTAGAGAFTSADVYALQESLPPRFQANARWASNLAVANDIAQFETTNGARLFPEITDSRLLRKPYHEVSDMNGDSTTTGQRILLYGDFRNFLIVDRIGSTIELVPHLFGTNNRPTGQRGFFLYFRTGSRVLVREALRVLVVA